MVIRYIVYQQLSPYINKIMLNSQTKPISPLKPKKLNANSSHGSLTPKYQSTFNASLQYGQSKHNSAHFSQQKSHCKCKQANGYNQMSCSSSGGVSYAQLQIILENLQKIKEKANSDLNSYKKTVNEQKSTIRELELKLSRYENIEQTIKTERELIKEQFKAELMSKGEQIQEYRQSIQKLQSQVRVLTSQNLQIKQKLALRQEKLNSTIKQLAYYQNKYEYLTKELKISNEEELVMQVKQKYASISQMLEYIVKMETKLEQQIENNSETKNTINQLNSRIQHSQSVEEHLISQTETLKSKNQALLKKASQNTSEIEELHQKIQSLELLLEEQQTRHNSQLEHSQKLLSQKTKHYQSTIKNLQLSIRYLQGQVKRVVDVEENNRNQQKFKAVVDQICDDSEDYENIVKRMQYLQKFRNEYYIMNSKIQYLCRLLDE